MFRAYPARKVSRNSFDYLTLCYRQGAFWWCSSADRQVGSSLGQELSYPDDTGHTIIPLGDGRVVYRVEDANDLCLAHLESTKKKRIRWVGTEISVSPDGKWLAYEEGDPLEGRPLRVVCSLTGTEKMELPNGTRVRFGREGELVWAWSWQSVQEQNLGGTVRVGHLQSGRLGEIRVEGASTPEVVAPGGGKVAVQGRDRTVRLYGWEGGSPVSEWESSDYLVGAVDGLLVMESRGKLTLRCAQTFSKVSQVESGRVFGLNDRYMATHQGRAKGGGTVKVWSLPDGKPVYEQVTEQAPGERSRFRFSDDGTDLVLLLEDGFLLSWSRGEGKSLSRPGADTALKPATQSGEATVVKVSEPLQIGLGQRVLNFGKSVFSAARFAFLGSGTTSQENWLQKPPRPYPVLAQVPQAARTPEESIAWVRGRLRSEAPLARRQQLEQLERFAQPAEAGAPPYSWDYDQRSELLGSTKAFFDSHRRNFEVQAQLFPLLELLTRGDFRSRQLIYYSNPGVMQPFREYLDDLPNPHLIAHQAEQKRRAEANPKAEVDGWILPELERRAGLTRRQKKQIRSKLVNGSLRSLLAHRPWDFSVQSERDALLRPLLKNDLVDPNFKLDPQLKRNLERAFGVELNLARCKRCGQSLNPAAMKKHDICWGCWDN